MKATLAVVIAGVGFAVAGPTLQAHHAFAAEYDANRPVTLKGIVTRIEWTNPHSHVFLDVTDDAGATNAWKLELASPTVLLQNGWRKKSLEVGDTVSVEAARAKDGSSTANARVFIFADGRRLSAGSSGGDVPRR